MGTSKSTRAPERDSSPIAGDNSTVELAGRPLREFRIGADHAYLVRGDQPPALVFNPGAHLEALASMLNAWACVADAEDVTANEIAEILQPQAEDVLALLEEIMRRVDLRNSTSEG